MAQLLHLESEDPDKDINLYINSPGGDITSLFAIYDTMQYVKPDVSTIVMGQAASAAAVLVLSGTKGKRYALPHSRILLHQPHGGAEGQAVDIEIQAKEITRYRKLLEELIAMHTGQPLQRVSKTPTATSSLPPRAPWSSVSWTRSSPAGRSPPNLQPWGTGARRGPSEVAEWIREGEVSFPRTPGELDSVGHGVRGYSKRQMPPFGCGTRAVTARPPGS